MVFVFEKTAFGAYDVEYVEYEDDDVLFES